MRTRWLPVLASIAASLPSCSVDAATRRADLDGGEVLAEKTEEAVGDRWQKVVQPKSAAVPPAAPVEPAEDAPIPEKAPVPAPPPARIVSLRESLEIAIVSNRDYIAEREDLQLVALGLFGVRHQYSPLLTAVMAYTVGDGEDTPAAQAATFSAAVSQILPTGGNLGLSAGTAMSDLGSGAFSNSLGITLTQPLLRGAGKLVAWEALTQAERSMVYAIREFERFRENFSIDVARKYYSLVGQKKSLENQRRNLEGVEFGRRQAEALFAVGRKSEIDVLRQRRSELQALNALNESEVQLQFALDDFRIFLGFDESQHLDVASEEPPFIDVGYDIESSVSAALANRLDFQTAKDRLEDSYRGLKIAENGLLPDLDLTANYAVAGIRDPAFLEPDAGDGIAAYTASVTFDLPVDRVSERSTLRNAQITRAQSLRAFVEGRDRLVAAVRASFRALDRRKKSLDIQRQLIVDQEKTVRKAQIEFERGDATNRDLVEAQQALLEAQNALISEQVQYEIARLELLRDLGILFIDEHGMWKE